MKTASPQRKTLLVSEYRDSIDVLLRARFLDPPAHPGLIACLDRFEVLRVVGVGGMGVVVLAREPASRQESAPSVQNADGAVSDAKPRLVAIKILKPELAGSLRASRQFVNEVRHMECLSHPHILPVLEVSEQSQRPQMRPHSDKGTQATCPVLKARRPYYVMPFIENGSLAGQIRSKGPLSSDNAALIAAQMASALAYVHDKGITHRDLNPSNILIDGQGCAFLTDFGLSRTVFNDPLVDTRKEQRVGTTPYMSPAVAMGEAEDTRCDIYAFGAVLYEMLTGRPPYSGPDTNAVIQQIVAGPPPPILTVNPGASRRLAQIAEGAMGRTLRERYARMADIAADLERIKNGKKPHGPRSGNAGGGQGFWKAAGGVLNRKQLLGMAAALALSAAGLLLWNPFAKPALDLVQTLGAPGIYRWEDSRLGDWDGDRHQELFLAHHGDLVIINEMGALLRASPMIADSSRHLALDMVAQAEKGRPSQAYLSWASDSGASIGVFEKSKKLLPIKQFNAAKPVQNNAAAADFSMTARRIADLHGDGRRQLLALLVSGPPRDSWLHCYDEQSTQLNWTYPLGGFDGVIESGDLNGDGRQEILAGYNEAGSSGVLALTPQGGLLWKLAMGDGGIRCTPLAVDLNRDNRLEILAWTTPAADAPTEKKQKILRIDAGGAVAAEYVSDVAFSSCTAAVLDRGRPAVVLAADRNGFLHCLDSNLNLMEKRRVVPGKAGDIDLRILDVVDLNQNGRPYIVLSSALCQPLGSPSARQQADSSGAKVYGEVSVRLLDAALKEVASKELMKWSKEPRQIGFYVADWAGGADPMLVFCADSVWLMRLKNSQK